MLIPLCAAITLISHPIAGPNESLRFSAPLETGPRAGCVATIRGESQTSIHSLAWICPSQDGPKVEELGTPTGVDQAPLSWTVRGNDGGAVFWFGVEGGVVQESWRAGEPLRSSTLLRDPTLAPSIPLDTVDVDLDGSEDLLQVAFDGLRAYARRADRLELLWTAPLPATFEAGRSIHVPGLLPSDLPTPTRYSALRTTADGRFRALRLALGAAPPSPCEVVIRPSQPLALHRAVQIPGDPDRVAAVALPANRFQVFGEYTLLVAPLRCDDTGRGTPPSAAFKTPMANWHGAALAVRPASGGRTAELWVLGSTGRFKPRPAIVVHSDDGREIGPQAKVWEGSKESEDGRILMWEDLTGDRLPELVIAAATRLLIYRGLPGPRSRWENVPYAALEFPQRAEVSDIQALDLDGDPQAELLTTIWRYDSATHRRMGSLVWIDLPAGPLQR